MSGTGWLLLLIGGLAAYAIIKSTGATYSANPLGNVLSPPNVPVPSGMERKWNGFEWVVVPQGAIAL